MTTKRAGVLVVLVIGCGGEGMAPHDGAAGSGGSRFKDAGAEAGTGGAGASGGSGGAPPRN